MTITAGFKFTCISIPPRIVGTGYLDLGANFEENHQQKLATPKKLKFRFYY